MANDFYHSVPPQDAMELTRRKTIVASGGVVASTLGVTLLSSGSSAAELSGSFDVPDKNKEITEPISTARLTAQGSFSWSADTRPTQAILRLEVSRSGTFEQIAVESYESGLSREHEQDFTLQGNLLDVSSLTAQDLSPTETGNTKQVNLSARLVLTVKVDGDKLAEETYSSQFALNTERTLGQISFSFGATGDVTLE